MLRGGARPEKVNWGLPDSVWAGVWLRVECAVCVIHLGLRRGSGRLLGLATAWGGASSLASGVVRAGVHYGYARRSKREMGQRGSSPRIKTGRR